MLYIGQVEYKMTETGKWHKGWLVGEHIDTANTLLDEKFKPVPKIVEEDGKEFMCHDFRRVMFNGVMVQM